MASSWSIVSSVIVWKLLQADGTSNVRELHTDNLNATYIFDYILDANSDPNVHLAADAITLLTLVPQQEITNNINAVETLGSLATPVFNYSTVANNIAALRQVYLLSTQTQAIMIGDFLNSLTNAQLETAFNLTLQEVTTLRTNYLSPAATTAVSIRSAMGT